MLRILDLPHAVRLRGRPADVDTTLPVGVEQGDGRYLLQISHGTAELTPTTTGPRVALNRRQATIWHAGGYRSTASARTAGVRTTDEQSLATLIRSTTEDVDFIKATELRLVEGPPPRLSAEHQAARDRVRDEPARVGPYLFDGPVVACTSLDQENPHEPVLGWARVTYRNFALRHVPGARSLPSLFEGPTPTASKPSSIDTRGYCGSRRHSPEGRTPSTRATQVSPMCGTPRNPKRRKSLVMALWPCQAVTRQRGVAQMARAPASKAGCRRFDSCRPCPDITLLAATSPRDRARRGRVWRLGYRSYPSLPRGGGPGPVEVCDDRRAGPVRRHLAGQRPAYAEPVRRSARPPPPTAAAVR